MTFIKASVIQACTASYGSPNSLALTLAKLERFVALAKQRDGSQIAVFPEAFIGGYPYGSSFGSVLGERTNQGRQQFMQYFKTAIEVPSTATQQIEAVSTKYGVFLVVGVVERDVSTLYCTVIFVHPTKGLLAKRRKLVPTAMERILWGHGDKSTLPLVQTSFQTTDNGTDTDVNIGAVICWENYMPLLRTYYYSKGIQLYCVPVMEDAPRWSSTMVHIAIEGRCHVLSACPYSQQKDFPNDHELPNGRAKDPNDVLLHGGSMIVSPLGEILAGPLRGQEGVISAELNLDERIMGKFDLDSVGHYSRNDIFELMAHDVPERHGTIPKRTC